MPRIDGGAARVFSAADGKAELFSHIERLSRLFLADPHHPERIL
ncbi:MAG: hypothetical protein ACT4O9_14025 [Blastocatellia bacterium]